MDESPVLEVGEKEIPRWIQVLRRAGSRLIDAALRVCFGDPVTHSEQEESRARHCGRGDPIARLSLGARKVLSFADRSQESGRLDDSEHVASGLFLLSRYPGRWLIHRLLSRDGPGGDISSGDVFLQLSGASCVGSETTD